MRWNGEGTATRDAGIIIGAHKVAHYEIAAHGSLVQLAKTIGKEDVADILQTTLDEENHNGTTTRKKKR